MGFENKTAIVTGSGRGMGRAMALGFARGGADVVVNYSRSEEKARECVQEIHALGKNAIAVKANVARKGDTQTLIQSALDQFGKIDILVNNAGIVRPAMLHKMTEDEWDSVIDVDLKGTFNCIQAVAPHMMERKYGKIVNVTSTAAQIGFRGNINYAAAKAGCDAITKTAAKELAPYGINVNAVAPSIIKTQFSEAVRENPKLRERYLSWTLLHRFGEPEEVAQAVMFLASDEASYITGHILTVDGGQTIAIA